ncbi:MAG: ComF family protein [Bacteroidota bacterium]|jgi:ComF family protein
MEKFIRILFSPWIVPTCRACNHFLTHNEYPLCWTCDKQLHKTNHFQHQFNHLCTDLSWRLPLFSAQSLTYFKQLSIEQRLLHQLKYRKSEKIGIWMGQQIAIEQRNCSFLSDVDVLLPIPMSHRSQRKRGYNQAEEIAKGIAQTLQIPIAFPLKKKHQKTSTTKKDRKSRMAVTGNPFYSCSHLGSFKHALIVDDVITTGSTIAHFISALECDASTKISLVTFSHTL